MCGCREHTDNFCTSLSILLWSKTALKKKKRSQGNPLAVHMLHGAAKKKKIKLKKKKKIIKSHEKILEK